MSTRGSVSLPTLTTWTGAADGLTWTSHGALEVVDRYAVKVERYDDVTADDWIDHSDLLQAFNTRHGVAGWWKGLFGGTCTLVLEDTDLRDIGVASGDAFLNRQYWRLFGRSAGGWRQLFYGRQTDVDRLLTPAGLPRSVVTIGDFVSLDAQDTGGYGAGGDHPSAWWVESILSSFANSNIDSPLSDHLDDLPATTAGLTCEGTAAWGGNLVAMLAGLAISELGLIWVDHESGRWQFDLLNWWRDPGTHYKAFMGGDDPAATAESSRTWDMRVRPSVVRERVKGRDGVVRWEWTYAGSGTPEVATATGLQPPPSASVSSRNSSLNDVGFLVNHLAETTATGATSTRQSPAVRATFAADLTIDHLDYALRAKVHDYVAVGRDALVTLTMPAQSADYPRYLSKYVMRVGHRWSAAAGWTCDIETDSYDLVFADEVVIT